MHTIFGVNFARQTAQVFSRVGFDRARGVGESDHGRIFGAGLEHTQAKIFGQVGGDDEAGVDDARLQLGVEGTLVAAGAGAFLVASLDNVDVPGGLLNVSGFGLGAAADVPLLPAETRLVGCRISSGGVFRLAGAIAEEHGKRAFGACSRRPSSITIEFEECQQSQHDHYQSDCHS